MKTKLTISLLLLTSYVALYGSVTERLATASKKISSLREIVSSGQLSASKKLYSNCRNTCKSCSGCKKSV